MYQNARRYIQKSGSALAVVFAFACCSAVHADENQKKYAFNIPAENTAQALMDFSRQADVQILFPYDVAAAHSVPAIKGEQDRLSALAQILEGSGLEIAEESNRVVTLRQARRQDNFSSADDQNVPTEVIVTGTHIRGGNPTSPVHTLSRKDIEQSGYSQVGDLIRSLPESFAGGQNPGVISGSSISVANANATNASTVNLRGLGPDATLSLVNGHRLTGDSRFQGADISGIPMGAIQRVEIVPDGSSALYGSDAVAGVVNFILRKNYDGAELSARVGTTSQGGGDEQTYSALAGRAGERGFGLVSLEYSNQDGIDYGQRGLGSLASPDNTLMQPQERISVFASAGHDLSDRIKLSVDVLYSERDTDNYFAFSAADTLYTTRARTAAYNVTPMVDIGLAGDWKARLTINGSGSRNIFTYYEDSLYTSTGVNKNDDKYVEVTTDGTLLTLPTGPVKAAIGAGYRQEGFYSGSYGRHERDVSFLYGEVLAPLVAPSVDRVGLNSLDLSLSARTENYSDLGSSTNPKIGLRYVPIQTVTVRASWGKSFKAPAFYQMFSGSNAYLYQKTGLGGIGAGHALLLFGGNPGLKPETSTSWTVGADYSPKSIPSLKLSATYFDIDYTDRVVQPVNNFATALNNPIYSAFVQLDPTSDEVMDARAGVDSLYNFTGEAYDPANVVAIVDDRLQNATAQTATGVDVSYRQSFDVGEGTLDLFANATWLNLHQQTVPSAPAVKLSGTIFSAPEFKARAGFSWRQGAWVVNGIVNQISPEDDTSVTPVAGIDGWTTADANISYKFGDTGSASGTRISLSALNLFDTAPPYTVTPVSNDSPHFDSTNASIVGRFVSLTIAKSW